MEGYVDEYEVDLRDILAVLWQKKWLILLTFIVTTSAAALVSFLMPDRYEVTALIRLRNLPQVEGVQFRGYGLPALAEIAQSYSILWKTAEETQKAGVVPSPAPSTEQLAAWLQGHLEADIPEETGLLALRLQGAWSPQILARMLEIHTRVLENETRDAVAQSAQEEMARLTSEMEVLQAQREALQQDIDQEIVDLRTTLEGQRDELRSELAPIEASPQKDLPAGEQNATLEGIILRERFTALNARLQGVERELDDLEARGERRFPELFSQLVAMDEEIRVRQRRLELIQRAVENWEPIEVVAPPTASPTPVGPNRLLNIAVAAVLGLFLGVFLAFSAHYLEGAEEKGRLESAQAPQTLPDVEAQTPET